MFESDKTFEENEATSKPHAYEKKEDISKMNEYTHTHICLLIFEFFLITFSVFGRLGK